MTARPRTGSAFGLRLWLVLAALGCGCRDRPPQARSLDWQAGTPEKAALLLLDTQGATTLLCLPAPASLRPLFAGTTLQQVLDVDWKEGLLLAGLVPDADDPGSNQLVVLSAHAEPRRLGRGVRSARFSPDGRALSYQVQNDGTVAPNTIVYDLTTDQTSELAGFADPLWEADGTHLRGSLAQKAADGSTRWLRARWDRQSQSTALVGPGSAQIPAPVGAAVAWSADQPGTSPSNWCMVRLGPPGSGQIPHKVQGAFCLGSADDRSVRWSPDGQWLAFPHPGPVPGGQDPNRSFLDVVAVAGGRSQSLMRLHSQVGPAASEIAVAPASLWLDWSPSQRFLAVADGAGVLRIYDFEVQGIATLGQGDRPRWSPGGTYLLMRAGDGASPAPRVFVLPGVTPSTRMDLGPTKDARWLPAQACDG